MTLFLPAHLRNEQRTSVWMQFAHLRQLPAAGLAQQWLKHGLIRCCCVFPILLLHKEYA